MKETPAWLLNIGRGTLMGVGERELLHLVEQPALLELPLAPRHCRYLLAWQGELLPVWDILAWLERDGLLEHTPLVGIIGYQSRQKEVPKLGAVVLAEPPVKIRVTDSAGCPLPAQPDLGEIALSCFQHEGAATPILDLPTMFSHYSPSRY